MQEHSLHQKKAGSIIVETVRKTLLTPSTSNGQSQENLKMEYRCFAQHSRQVEILQDKRQSVYMRDHSSKWTSWIEKPQLDSSWGRTGREPRLRNLDDSRKVRSRLDGLHLQGVHALSIYSDFILNTELISKSIPVFLVFLAKQRVATSGSTDGLHTIYPTMNTEFNSFRPDKNHRNALLSHTQNGLFGYDFSS